VLDHLADIGLDLRSLGVNRRASIVRLLVIVQLFIAAGVANAQTMKVACVGDSITAFPTGWCGYLGTKLGSGYTTQTFGVSGTTLLKNVGQPAFSSSSQYKPSHDFAPNIVVIMLGTNDSASRNWNAGKDHFVKDYEELIDSYTSLASKPTVFLNTPPPASDDNMFTISGTIIENEINPLIKQVAMTKRCPLVDVWAAFDGDVENLDSFDGVHPGDSGQMTIAETVYQAIKSPNVPGGNAGAGGSAGSAGSANAGGGGVAGGVNTSGAGGGSANTGGASGSGGKAGGSASGGAGGSSNTGGNASLAGAGGSANAAGNSSSVTAGATGSAPVATAPASSDGGCRASGNFTSERGPTPMILLLLGIVMIRSGRRRV
jgi:acyl-CoA thioesterase I